MFEFVEVEMVLATAPPSHAGHGTLLHVIRVS